MRTSNPPSYDKIFEIHSGSANVTEYALPASDAMMIPNHRGLLIIASDVVEVEFFNLSHTLNEGKTAVVTESKSTMTFPANTAIVLPLQIKYYNVVSGGSFLFLYGLL